MFMTILSAYFLNLLVVIFSASCAMLMGATGGTAMLVALVMSMTVWGFVLAAVQK